MAEITRSGLFSDDFGRLVLVTQGLSGCTLVAHKKILFRLFLDVAAANPTAVLATITFKLFGLRVEKSIMIPSGSLLIENSSPNGPSVGVVFTGDVFAFPGTYDVAFSVHGNPSPTSQIKLTDLVFLRPGSLRLLIHNLAGTAPWGTKIEPNIDWLIEMFQALERFSAMLPVRDGIKFGLTHKDAGLCWLFGENIDPWACPSGPCTAEENIAKTLRETKEINSRGTSEHVDATISWRPRDLTKFPPPGGESAGGAAIPAVGLASFVGGNEGGREKTASVMAQEVGHLFGLEPPDSPYSDGGAHSKERAIVDPFAFDFLRLRPYQPPPGDFIGDVMGVGWHQGRDLVLYNAFDWEHLRRKLVQLPGVSGLLTAEERPTQKEEDKLADDFQKRYADEPEIRVAHPGGALSTKEGFAWHWTPRGFQLVRRVEPTKTGSGLAASVEGILAWLADLGVSEVYAPVGERSLHVVINPNASASLPEESFDVPDRTEGGAAYKRAG